MKTKINILFLFLLILPLMSIAQSNYYYYFNKKIYLNPVPSKYTIVFTETADESILINNGIEYEELNPIAYEITGNYQDLLTLGNGVFKVNQLYTYKGNDVNLSDEIVLRFKDETTETQKQNLVAQYNLDQIVDTERLKVYKTNNPLVIANTIYETGLVKYCQPNFFINIEPHYIPNDEYFNKQFYLHNYGQSVNGQTGTNDADIDMPEAWEITMGDPNIVIAVIDQGVTDNHPDLPSSRQIRLLGSNLHPYDMLPPGDPSPTSSNNHGNACAGIIGATIDNGIGIAGIAPNCKIMPIKIPLEGQFGITASVYGQAVNFAADNGADIISNSWGYGIDYSLPNAPIADAIRHALTWNVSVVFSAGNTARHTDGNDGFVAYPANLPQEDVDEYNLGVDLISVGASDRNDQQANYSPTDIEVDISAPSHSKYVSTDSSEGGNIYTLDIPGILGYNPWNDMPGSWDDGIVGAIIPNYGSDHLSYTGLMGGTSSSAPQVAGVIALMKSVNPCLTVTQIKDIIQSSADKVGDYNYNWNSDMSGHSKELGYGRLNAYNSVVMAQSLYNEGFDLYIKDNETDLGVEPDTTKIADYQFDNGTKHALWSFNSPDIWIRNQNDGFDNQENQQIEYITGQPVYVYVKVRSNGCEITTGNELLELYWSKNATIQNWSEYWDGSITNPVLMGNYIGEQTIDAIVPHYIPNRIIEFEWYPPNPQDYEDYNSQPWSFSVLARIISDDDPITNEATGAYNIVEYIASNNNIAAKSIAIIDVIKDENDNNDTSLLINNPSDQNEIFDLYLRNDKAFETKSVLEEAEVILILDETLWQIWSNANFDSENIQIIEEVERKVFITNPNYAVFKNLTFGPFQSGILDVSINFLTDKLSDRSNYNLNIAQKIALSNKIVGGSTILVKKPIRPVFDAFAGDDIEVSLNEVITLNADDIDENAIYKWYDENNNLIYTGKDFSLSVEISKKYKLEIIADIDGFKDYDEVEVNIKQAEITNISPNPVNQASNLLINYNPQNATSLYIVIAPITGSFYNNYILDSNQSEKTIDITSFNTGLYVASLVSDGQVTDQKTFIVE